MGFYFLNYGLPKNYLLLFNLLIDLIAQSSTPKGIEEFLQPWSPCGNGSINFVKRAVPSCTLINFNKQLVME